MRLYKTKNYAAITGTYVLTIGVAAASFMLGAPWMIALGVLFVGGLSGLVIKLQKDFLENKLVKYEETHKHSPRLGAIVKELYQKSGLTAESYPVYDFRPDEKKLDGGTMDKLWDKVFGMMAETHNAAALRLLGKPVIMISEPALELLNDEEEKAVLAHEFAHAVAHHTHVGIPQRLIGSVASFTNSLTQLVAAFAAGVGPFLLSVVTGMAARAGFFALRRSGKALIQDDTDEESKAEKKKAQQVTNAVGSVASTAVLVYFNPAYLPVYASTQALKVSSGLLSQYISRSMEYQADTGAVELGADPLALITSLRKLNAANERTMEAINGKPLPKKGKLTKIWNDLNTTHPPLEKRIDNLSNIARKKGVSEDLIKKAANDPVVIPPENIESLKKLKSIMG